MRGAYACTNHVTASTQPARQHPLHSMAHSTVSTLHPVQRPAHGLEATALHKPQASPGRLVIASPATCLKRHRPPPSPPTPLPIEAPATLTASSSSNSHTATWCYETHVCHCCTPGPTPHAVCGMRMPHMHSCSNLRLQEMAESPPPPSPRSVVEIGNPWISCMREL